MNDDFKTCLINASNPNGPQGNDSYTDFRQYSSWSDGKWRSWHSIPCALKTEFFAYNGENFHRAYQYDGVIVLVNHQPEKVIPLVKKLKMMGKKVAIGYHESGQDFIFKASSDFFWLNSFISVCNESDFYLNIIPSMRDFYEGIFSIPVKNIFHAIPCCEWKHEITKTEADRNGILVATRTFDQRISRNTLLTLGAINNLSKQTDDKITVVGESFDEVPFQMNNMKFTKAPMPYLDWLDLISRHKLVVHLDASNTLGQVVTDAALVEVDCVGGNSYNNIVCETNADIYNFLYKVKESLKNPGQFKKIKSLFGMKNLEESAKKIFDV